MNQAFLKVLISEIVKVATIPFRLMPIKKNRILFTGLTGGKGYDYSCNPKYVYEYLRDNFPGKYEYVWAVAETDKYSFLREEGVKLVKHYSISSFASLLTAKVIVTNGSYAPWLKFRKKQYVINTWHGGGAYKKVENERPDANWSTRKRAKFCADNIDLFLASCKTQEDNMIKKTYIYEGDILKAGTPRNDKLVRGETKEMAKKARQSFGIPEDGRIVLFAPTYRTPSEPVHFDCDRLLAALGEGWYFMSRFHRFQDDGGLICIEGDNVIDVCDYPDMQELLCAADILVTDYSSCIWDYAFLKRPCFLFVPDKEEYVAKTGFYVDVDRWPFKQVKDIDELIQAIDSYDSNESDKLIEEHLEYLGSYETGNCCKAVSDKIMTACGEKQ